MPKGQIYPDIAIFCSDVNILGEGILFLEDHNSIAWVDIEGRALCWQSADDKELRQWRLADRPTAIAAWVGQTLLLSTERALHSFCLANGTNTTLLTIDLDAGIRLNDGATDPMGRFWVGSMDEINGKPLGKIYCLHPDGNLEVMSEGIGITNGIAFADGGRIMYYADSAAGEIYRCDVDIRTGRLSNRSVFATNNICPGTPDGAAVDREGYLWSCRWDGWGIARFAPDGALDRFIDLPVARPTRCSFGGPELKTLYVSTARIDLSDAELADQPLAGSVLQVSLPIAGDSATPYAASIKAKFSIDSSSH